MIPKHVLEAPPPSEGETLRTFALLAVGARGALTEAAIREHWRLQGARRGCTTICSPWSTEGRLREVEVDDGGAPFYVLPTSRSTAIPHRRCPTAPFDNLVWDRPLLVRLFGFKHLIEVYKRKHERRAWGTTSCRCSRATASWVEQI